MKKSNGITILIILGVITLAFIVINRSPQTDEGVAKCIGQNSKLYVQLGCHACEIQEEMFGENYHYLNVIDCFYTREECITKGITTTPTWIISNQQYKGVQSINKLKELTGC